MTQAEYNAAVQDMQSFCISAGLDDRVRPVYVNSVVKDDPPILHAAVFEVFYATWREIGRQTAPMTPEVLYDYDFTADAKLRAEVARDIF